jgi:trimeric autotransporter adhesin
MSTKTTFKRVALVAVAALGLGVLSVAPSQAAHIGDAL